MYLYKQYMYFIIVAVLDVPVDEAQVMISIRNIKGVKMPEEIEVSMLCYTCPLFLSQRCEIFILLSVRVSEDDPTISKDFRKLLRTFQRILKF